VPRRLLRITAVPLAILAGFPAAAAEVFRWTDADGRVQFGDRPPADVVAEQVEVGTAASVSGDLEQRREHRERFLGVIEEQRAEGAQAEAESAKQEAARREKCGLARDQAQKIENAQYIYEPTGDPANPRILDEAERADYLARAREDVSTWCRQAGARQAPSTPPAKMD
jgi:hypothetical protein